MNRKSLDLTDVDRVGKKYLVDSLVAHKGFQRPDAVKAVEGVFDAVVTALRADTAVFFSNIGRIAPIELAERVRYNPKTAEKFLAPAVVSVRWKSSPTLLDVLNDRTTRDSLAAKAPKGSL